MNRSSSGIAFSISAATSRICSFDSVWKLASTMFIFWKLTRRSVVETFVSASSLMVPMSGLSPDLARRETALKATMCACRSQLATCGW